MMRFPSHFTTADGLALPCKALLPPAGAPHRAAIVIVHGLGDHMDSASYRVLADHLLAQGYACYLYDQRGFGRAPGPRAFAASFEEVRDDLRRFIELVRSSAGGLPLFVAGLSLGGLIALDQAIEHPSSLAGVVAGAPALGEPAVPRLLVALAPLLSRVAPRFRLDPGLDLDNLTRDAEAARAYIDDPLFELRISSRLGWEILRAMRATTAAAPRLQLPVLLWHGADDRITSPDASRAFHARCISADKTLIIHPSAVHDPLIDAERDDVLRDISRWLDARAPANARDAFQAQVAG